MKINQFILKRKNYIFGLIKSSKLGKPTEWLQVLCNGDVEIHKESGVPLDSTINMLINISGQDMNTKVTIKTTKK